MPSDEKLPWFKMYPQKFMGDENVQLMGPTELGVYLAMLMHEWKAGSVPDDPAMVARICRGSVEQVENAWPLVRPCFEESRDGRLIQQRMERERRKALERRERARKAGKASGAARGEQDDQRDVEQNAEPDAERDVELEGQRKGERSRASDKSDVQMFRGKESTDVQSDSEGKPSGEDAAAESSRDGNRWSETVAACREHLWLDDAPPEGRSIGEELSVAKQLLKRWNLNPPDVAEAVEGFARLRERGFWGDWVERGEPAKMLALNQTPDGAQGIPVVVRCLHEMRKGERASRGDGGMERLKVSA